MVRSTESLRRDQQAILNSYREERRPEPIPDAAPAVSASTSASELAYGRVVEIVTDNAELGPYLVIVRQTWTGTPPVPADARTPGLCCYPTPNRIVNDFQPDQIVRICIMPGVTFAEPLA